MDYVIEFSMFFLKVAVIVIAVLIVISNIVASSLNMKSASKKQVSFKNKSEEFEKDKKKIELLFLNKKEAKKINKKNKKAEKKKKILPPTKKVFLMDFEGDIKASATEDLSDQISQILSVAQAQDEVLIRLESPGGLVSGYGLAASELNRIKSAGIKLNVCVDKVAASGGYMMACVADTLYAAPFAIIGSIGVVAQIPNFNKLLKKNNIDFETLTAGEYKRTLTLFGENTSEGRAKFIDQLEDVHKLFKTFINEHRPKVAIEEVATGEYWFGKQCLEKNLVDEIATSSDVIQRLSKDFTVFEVSTDKKKSFIEKISESTASTLSKSIENGFFWKGI